MLILTPSDRLNMQPEELSEGELTNLNEESGVTKKMKMSQRKNFTLNTKKFYIKETLRDISRH